MLSSTEPGSKPVLCGPTFLQCIKWDSISGRFWRKHGLFMPTGCTVWHLPGLQCNTTYQVNVFWVMHLMCTSRNDDKYCTWFLSLLFKDHILAWPWPDVKVMMYRYHLNTDPWGTLVTLLPISSHFLTPFPVIAKKSVAKFDILWPPVPSLLTWPQNAHITQNFPFAVFQMIFRNTFVFCSDK